MRHRDTKHTPETSFIGEREVLKHRRVQRALKRSSIVGDWSDLFGEDAPDALQKPYVLDEDGEKRNAAIMQNNQNAV